MNTYYGPHKTFPPKGPPPELQTNPHIKREDMYHDSGKIELNNRVIVEDKENQVRPQHDVFVDFPKEAREEFQKKLHYENQRTNGGYPHGWQPSAAYQMSTKLPSKVEGGDLKEPDQKYAGTIAEQVDKCLDKCALSDGCSNPRYAHICAISGLPMEADADGKVQLAPNSHPMGPSCYNKDHQPGDHGDDNEVQRDDKGELLLPDMPPNQIKKHTQLWDAVQSGKKGPHDYSLHKVTPEGEQSLSQARARPLYEFLEKENECSDEICRRRLLSIHPPHDPSLVHKERNTLAAQMKVDRTDPAITGLQMYMREALVIQNAGQNGADIMPFDPLDENGFKMESPQAKAKEGEAGYALRNEVARGPQMLHSFHSNHSYRAAAPQLLQHRIGIQRKNLPTRRYQGTDPVRINTKFARMPLFSEVDTASQ
ncbi:unnamed protein product [Amoebophrya sp. A120]|nr:unnamed protein product [Amoebophrya sp. A120]|eukprot:GSA120T00014652001.1